MFLYFVYTLRTREWAVNDGFHELRLLHWAIDLGWRPSEAVTGIVIGFFTADSLAFIESQEKNTIKNPRNKQCAELVEQAKLTKFLSPLIRSHESPGRWGPCVCVFVYLFVFGSTNRQTWPDKLIGTPKSNSQFPEEPAGSFTLHTTRFEPRTCFWKVPEWAIPTRPITLENILMNTSIYLAYWECSLT